MVILSEAKNPNGFASSDASSGFLAMKPDNAIALRAATRKGMASPCLFMQVLNIDD